MQRAIHTKDMKKATVFKWFKRFKDGRSNISDDACSGRPSVMHLSIFCPPGGAAGIHGALDRRPFLTGGNLINLWNPGPG